MNYVGIDLHKKTITVCVVNKEQRVLKRKRLWCNQEPDIVEFFQRQRPFEAVVEATAGYEWLVRLIEPLAERVILAHPGKLRVIAESSRKSDRLDAQVLAEFLALDSIPRAYRPTPRQHDHRRLVRQRVGVQRRIGSCRSRLRRILADYNADVPWLFTAQGLDYFVGVKLSPADRFAADQILAEWRFQREQLAEADRRLRAFAQSATIREQEWRALLQTIPMVGFVTIEVVLSELADVDRFSSQKKAVAYAGLAPGQRQSGQHRKALHIEKKGSGLLRWILVEAAWRLVSKTARWRAEYERLKARLRPKKAIVALARRLLCVIVAMLQSGQPYDPAWSAAGPLRD